MILKYLFLTKVIVEPKTQASALKNALRSVKGKKHQDQVPTAALKRLTATTRIDLAVQRVKAKAKTSEWAQDNTSALTLTLTSLEDAQSR